MHASLSLQDDVIALKAMEAFCINHVCAFLFLCHIKDVELKYRFLPLLQREKQGMFLRMLWKLALNLLLKKA